LLLVPGAAGGPEQAGHDIDEAGQGSAGHVCMLYDPSYVKATRREKLAFDDPEALQALCGSNNARLKLVERTSGAQVNLRGNEVMIEGEDAAVETAKSALEQLYDLALNGKALSSDDVVRAVQL